MSLDQAQRPLSAYIAEQAASVETELTPSAKEYLLNSLRSLGPDSDTIAETLGEMGFFGDHNASSCPIATYLQSHPMVSVAAACAEHTYVIDVEGQEAYLENPDAVEEFVSRFDDGDFPELEHSDG